MTKTVRSRFDHEIGEQVEGGVILEKRVVIPPDPDEHRRGVYEYVVDVPPAPEPASKGRSGSSRSSKPAPSPPPERGTYTRATPDEMNSVIRRLPSR